MIDMFSLLIMFQLKHWVCDYPLQTPYMLNKFRKVGWVFPLSAHSMVHSCGTMLLTSTFILITHPSFNYVELVLLLGLLDFVVHFIVDRIKAHPDLGGEVEV